MTLTLEGITRRFGRHLVLDGINLVVDRPTSLVGANGSGKTTLLRIAAGILTSEGRARLDGENVRTPAARAGIGYLGQEPALYDDLDAVEHITWWTRLQGRPATMGDARTWVAEAGIANRRAGTLSRGQRQRLAIAMCFAAKPRVLILDEPTSALDAEGQAWFDKLLEGHQGPSLVAWHDQARASRARVVRLEGGRLEGA